MFAACLARLAWWLERASVLTVAGIALGCSAAPPPPATVVLLPPPPPPTSVAEPPPDAFPLGRAMTFQVVASSVDLEGQALAYELIQRLSASHPRTLVATPTTPLQHGVDVFVVVSVRDRHDMPPDEAETTATVTASDLFGVQIGARSVTYRAAGGRSREHTDHLLQACTGETLEAYARLPEEERVRRSQEAAAAAGRRAEEDRRRTRENAERSWTEGYLAADCRPPITSGSCHQLDAFVRTQPQSPHIEEARRLLEKARPTFTRLREKEWWSIASSACRNARSSDACAELVEHLATYPNGPHVREGQRILVRGRAAIERREREEEAGRSPSP